MDGKGDKGVWLAFQDGAGRLIRLCTARCFLVGDDAQCDVHGLNRPFRLDDIITGQPPSRIPNGQGTHTQVALQCHVMLALVVLQRHLERALVSLWHLLWQPNRFAFALIWATLKLALS